jgi:beta-lactamase regulating signal transducer with metallopeptidase domain
MTSLAYIWFADASRLATGSLVSAIWQGILLAAIAALVLRLLPKIPAAVRFAIWFAVFLIVIALPLLSLMHLATTATAHSATRGPWLTLSTNWAFAIAAIWLLASLVRAATLIAAALRVRALWKRATPIDIPTAQPAAGSRRAQICTSNEVDRPTVIGFFSPKILIPGWLLDKLTPAELEQVVLHEAGHLTRADDWMNLLQKIALVLFPLNPALAWIERRLCFERELACDERVLHATGAPKAYASCLATLAEYRLQRRGLGLALALGALGRECALGRESELARRVLRILRRREHMKPLHAKLVLSGAMLSLFAGAAALDRCPQLVGFSPAESPATAQTASIAAPTRIATRTSAHYQYQAVVFHPQSRITPNPSSPTPGAPSSRNKIAQSGVIAPHKQPSLSVPVRLIAYRVIADSAPSINRKVSRTPDSDSDAQIPAEMVRVVVTAWERPDGSRLVLTTVSRTAGTTPAAAQPHPIPQAHPYAAVPTRDGWLVLQL